MVSGVLLKGDSMNVLVFDRHTRAFLHRVDNVYSVVALNGSYVVTVEDNMRFSNVYYSKLKYHLEIE